MRRLTSLVAAAVALAGLLAVPSAGRPVERGPIGGELGLEARGTGPLPAFATRGGTMIRLLAGAFDPRTDRLPAPPGIALRDAARLPAGVAQYWLVQVRDQRFAHVTRAVEAAGGTIAGTIPEDTYVVRATPAQRAAIARDPAVRWTGYYQPAWRVPAAAAGRPGLLELAGEQTYRVYAFRDDPDAEAVGRALAAMPGVEVESDAGLVVDVRATAAQVAAIASLPGVEWVGIKPTAVPLNVNARWVNDTGVRDVYAATAPGRLTGAGQTAAVADSGLNYTYDLNGRAHVGFRDCNPDGTGCKQAIYTQANPGNSVASMTTIRNNATGHRKMVAYFDLGNAGPNMYDPSSHGSHVAGSVTGDQPPFGAFTDADGLAPGANHVHQNVATPSGSLGGLPADDYELWRQAYRPRSPGTVSTTSSANGNPSDYTTNYRPAEDARTHNNSYGLIAPVVDEGSSVRLDRFVWDHEDMLIVVSAGNLGPTQGTIGAPSVAKNNLSSAASANGRQPMASIDSLGSFSSHGPTGDGRFGPDLATPGQIVVSAKGGSTDGYHVAQGTSMSGPILTGLATLVRQYFYDGWAASGGDGFAAGAPDGSRRHNPSAALVRATLVNGAVRMRGYYTGDEGTLRAQDGQWPSAGQGFGQVNLDNSLYFSGDPASTWYADVYRSDTANADVNLRPFPVSNLPATRTFTMRVEPGQPLDVTLAWTDAPNLAPAGTPALVNNLDLVVTGPGGQTYVGNNMNSRALPGVDVAETLNAPVPRDLRNTTERVRVASPQAGTYTISVEAGPIITGNQGFALAASGNISPVGGPAFQPGPPLQADGPGPPAISNVRIETISADTAKILFDTNEPTTAEAEVAIAGTPTTFVDSYNVGPQGFPGLNAASVETSAEYADKPVVGTKHEILVTGLTPGQAATATLRARDLHDPPHERSQAVSLRSPTSVFQADAPDIGQLYEDPSVTAGSWRTGTQLYASDSGSGDGILGAFGFRVPSGAVDPAAIEGAVVELTSTHQWVVPYTSDPVHNVDLLESSVEAAWGTQRYGEIKSAGAAARFYPETTHRRGAYQKYAFTLRCSDLPALRDTLTGTGEQLAAFRWESSADPVGGYFAMEFGFNRRSRGPAERPKLMLFADGRQGYPDGRACDPATPAPAISDVGVRGGHAQGSVTVTWETDVASDSMVIFREQGTEEWTQVATPALTKVHQVQVFGLDPEKRYEFAVRSAACNGAATTDANGGAGYDFFRVSDMGTPTTHAHYGFETSAEGWTVTTPLTSASSWVRTTPGANGTANGWHVAIGGAPTGKGYTDLTTTTLTSPAVTVGGATAAIRFFLARDIEPGFDVLRLQYSANNGSTWTTLRSFDGTNGGYPNYELNAREVSFANPSPGGQLRFRFQFVSDEIISSPLYLGASVDEVTVLSYPTLSGGNAEQLPLTGPVPPPSAGATGLTPPATRTGPASEADIAAGTGLCSIGSSDEPPTAEGAGATGGGWLDDGEGNKVNFGFNVRETGDGRLEGNLQLNHRARSVKVHLADVTSLTEGTWGANSLEFRGTGTFNGTGPATFRVRVQDNGEGAAAPADRFFLECLAGCGGGYATASDGADDSIDGGNIQVRPAAGGGGESGAGEPSTLILDPLLLTEGILGQVQLFTVTVYDEHQRPLPNAQVELSGGAQLLSLSTDVAGKAVFLTVNPPQAVEYVATAGKAQSNTIHVTPLTK